MRHLYAIEGGACRSHASVQGAVPLSPPERAWQEPVPDIRLRDIAASRGRASLWPARRAIVVRHSSSTGLTISLTVPFRHYQGVSVELTFSEQGEVSSARIVLAHADKGLEVEVFKASDDCDVIAEWRRWGRELGLPLLMRTSAGDEVATSSFGALAISRTLARRRSRASWQRRPLAARRRIVSPASEPIMLSADSEIISYD